MTKIQTTAKDFRAGVPVAASKSTIVWEPVGHLSVKLLDASGTRPLANASLTVQVPKEGKVELSTDSDGSAFHADVPFQDYELDLGEIGKVTVPAVAQRGEQHVVAVASARFGWIDLQILDEDGIPLVQGVVVVDGHSAEIQADAPGRVFIEEPLPKNAGKSNLSVDGKAIEVELPLLPGRTVVRLTKKGAK